MTYFKNQCRSNDMCNKIVLGSFGLAQSFLFLACSLCHVAILMSVISVHLHLTPTALPSLPESTRSNVGKV